MLPLNHGLEISIFLPLLNKFMFTPEGTSRKTTEEFDDTLVRENDQGSSCPSSLLDVSNICTIVA